MYVARSGASPRASVVQAAMSSAVSIRSPAEARASSHVDGYSRAKSLAGIDIFMAVSQSSSRPGRESAGTKIAWCLPVPATHLRK
jgi:hypothetical protein